MKYISITVQLNQLWYCSIVVVACVWFQIVCTITKTEYSGKLYDDTHTHAVNQTATK